MLIHSKLLRTAVPLAALFALVAGSAALAQRDPAYAAARANGQVGEMIDGYLGVVGAQGADIKRLVDDLNIKRKQVYFQRAQELHVTPDEYAFSTGCTLISKTVAGEMYQAPDGGWKARTSSPPVLHSKCP